MSGTVRYSLEEGCSTQKIVAAHTGRDVQTMGGSKNERGRQPAASLEGRSEVPRSPDQPPCFG